MTIPSRTSSAIEAEQRPHYLGQHYDTVEQQFSSSKLGMWLFLATEVLLFAGLFCAYAVYRRFHPEVFEYAHHFLDTKWGAINTIILIFSSLTMALAVRASQKGQTAVLIGMLSVTFLCGAGFLGIKYVEYSHKFHDGLLWGTRYNPSAHESDAAHGDGPVDTEHGDATSGTGSRGGTSADASGVAERPGVDVDAGPGRPLIDAEGYEMSIVPRAAEGPRGLAGVPAPVDTETPRNVHLFFGIYFLMTGLHGLHVIIGMIVIGWLIVRAALRHFGPEYFTPVDLGGLYWHLVDLIWIFLFPLLYLID